MYTIQYAHIRFSVEYSDQRHTLAARAQLCVHLLVHLVVVVGIDRRRAGRRRRAAGGGRRRHGCSRARPAMADRSAAIDSSSPSLESEEATDDWSSSMSSLDSDDSSSSSSNPVQQQPGAWRAWNRKVACGVGKRGERASRGVGAGMSAYDWVRIRVLLARTCGVRSSSKWRRTLW